MVQITNLISMIEHKIRLHDYYIIGWHKRLLTVPVLWHSGKITRLLRNWLMQALTHCACSVVFSKRCCYVLSTQVARSIELTSFVEQVILSCSENFPQFVLVVDCRRLANLLHLSLKKESNFVNAVSNFTAHSKFKNTYIRSLIIMNKGKQFYVTDYQQLVQILFLIQH